MGYEEIQEESLACLECGDKIEYGRNDRKFCCDSCKNRYNNRKARGSRIARTKVIAAIERNYAILEKLIRLGIQEIGLTELAYLGFDIMYVTSYCKHRRHDEYGCFDIHFTVMSERVVSISRYSPIIR